MGSVLPQTVKLHQWADWADQTAGTGVNEYLGWGWKRWKFWFQEPVFCSILMGGVYSRAFDGKRKKWGGARTEVEKAVQGGHQDIPVACGFLAHYTQLDVIAVSILTI